MQADPGDEGAGDVGTEPGLGGDAPVGDEAQWATLERVREGERGAEDDPAD
jgi:hypothetical protein